MNRTQFLISASLLACGALAQPATAQRAPAPPATSQADPAASDNQMVQEVIVTAERRVNTAQKTAASVSVRAGDDMQSQGRYELKNILEDVPGVVGGAATSTNSSQGSGTDNPATGLIIRGVQSNQGAGGSVTSTAPAAAIYVDDVYSGIGGSYDIDRVEVLRGPQGTLYGRSATSGVVAIRTTDPDAARFGARGALEFGNYSTRHYTGAVNLPIIDGKLALRVSGNLYDRDGYYSAEGGAISTKDFRAKALWTPTDNLSVLVGYAQNNSETHSGGVSITQCAPPPGTCIPGTFNFDYNQQVAPTGKNNAKQFWANFNLDLGSVELTYIPAYRTWDENALLYLRSPVFNANQTVLTPDDSFLTHELRLHSKDSSSKLQWQVGFLHYQNSLTSANDLYSLGGAPPPGSPPGTPPSPPGYAFRVKTHKTTGADGGFAEATYSFAPDTRVTAGARYDRTDLVNTGSYTSVLGITLPLTAADGSKSFDNFTYKLRLEHDLAPGNLLYGAVSTGFSPGDVTQTTDITFNPVIKVLKAETLTAYEVGSKNRFLDNHLQVNGDVFYYDYGAYQTAGLNTSPGTPQTPTFDTIGLPMKSYGVELEVEARPTPNGRVSFNASYTHARYGDFGQYGYLFARHEVPGVAPFQGSLAYDHRFPIGSAMLLVRGAVRYFTGHDTSAIPPSWEALGAGPFVHVGSHFIGDLNATLLLEPHFSITAYVRNVANSKFIPDGWGLAGVFPPPPGGTEPTISESGFALSDPRTIGLTLGFKF
jgi:iron complex outermembrane receptor protein